MTPLWKLQRDPEIHVITGEDPTLYQPDRKPETVFPALEESGHAYLHPSRGLTPL